MYFVWMARHLVGGWPDNVGLRRRYVNLWASQVVNATLEAVARCGGRRRMGDQHSSMTRYGILGELVAVREAVDLRLGPTQQRVVLAVLLLHANQRIGREQLIDAIWGEAVPTYSVNLVQKHISSLRRLLDPQRLGGVPSALLSWTDSGYRIEVPAGCLDLEDFERGVRAARGFQRAGDLPAALAALDAAVKQWRGPLVDGLSSPLIDAERDRLSE